MRTDIYLASKDTCSGCLACIDSCPKNAIHACIHSDGHLYPEIERKTCVKCGRCMDVCPVISNYNYEDIIRKSKPFAVWANDTKLRLQSASGGLFSALSVYVLSKGGVVAGASMEGLEVKHILIEEKSALWKIQNSKYQQVNSKGIYKSIKEKLGEGITVLFGGTSCQIAGLYCFLRDKEYVGKLYTVDMICSGFPSSLVLNAFLKNESRAIQTVVYRDKEDGTEKGQRLTIMYQDINDGAIKTELKKHDLIYSVFGTHYTHRSSCLNCRFTYAKRKADITMADFWGDTEFLEEHYKGLSLAIVHSDDGLQLMKSADLTMHLSTWEKALKVNFRMVYGRFKFLNFHPARIFYPWLFHHCSYKTLLKVYRGAEKYSIIWYPYLFFSKLIGYLASRERRRYVERIKKNI